MKKITLLFAFLIAFSFANAQSTYTEDWTYLANGWYNDDQHDVNQPNQHHFLTWNLKDVLREGSSRTETKAPGFRGRYEVKDGAAVIPYFEAKAIKGGITNVTFEAGTFWTPTPLTATGGFKIYIDNVLVKTTATQPRNPTDIKWTVNEDITGAGADAAHDLRIELACPECTSDGDKFNLAIGAVSWTSVDNSLSVKDNALNKALSVYPNPATGLLNVTLNNNVSARSVQLVDLTGKSVYSSNNAKAINVSKFARGLYILKVTSNDGATASKKVVLQ